MQELPLLTDVARTILRCCAYNLDDMRKFGKDLRPHMIHSYFDEKFENHISKIEIADCLLYFEEVGLIRDVEKTSTGSIHAFKLSHTGFYYFELEKALKKQYRKQMLCDSFLLPVIVSLITTILTIIISA